MLVRTEIMPHPEVILNKTLRLVSISRSFRRNILIMLGTGAFHCFFSVIKNEIKFVCV